MSIKIRAAEVPDHSRDDVALEDADYAVVFAGPDDADTCEWCDDAVQGNPYTLDDCPEPGMGDCMNRCRHFTQMSDDAPADLAPYEWHGLMGFGSIPDGYYEDVVRDQDLLPRWNVDGSRFHQAYSPSVDGIDLPHVGSILGDIGRSKAPGSILPRSADILSDQLAPALVAARNGQIHDLAEWLWDTGIEPQIVKEWLELKAAEYVHLVATYDDIKQQHANKATVMTWLRRGDIEKLYDVMDTPQFAAILTAIASAGLPPAESTMATLLGNVLGVAPTYDTQANRWTFDVSSIRVREAGTASSGDRGHAGRPGERGGSAPNPIENITVGRNEDKVDTAEGYPHPKIEQLQFGSKYLRDETVKVINRELGTSMYQPDHIRFATDQGEIYSQFKATDALAWARNPDDVEINDATVALHMPDSDIFRQSILAVKNFQAFGDAATIRGADEQTVQYHDPTIWTVDQSLSPGDQRLEGMLTHEMGHVLWYHLNDIADHVWADDDVFHSVSKDRIPPKGFDPDFRQEWRDVRNEMLAVNPSKSEDERAGFKQDPISNKALDYAPSQYAMKNGAEYFAECYVAYRYARTLPKFMSDFFKKLDLKQDAYMEAAQRARVTQGKLRITPDTYICNILGDR